MQAVILSAGKGSRMKSLTIDTPKSMLVVKGKTLLEHKFDALPEQVNEIILVVGYLSEKIKEKFGDSYKGKKVTYVTQENPVGGTMNALEAAKDILHDKFFVMYGDDFYSAEDMKRCLEYSDWVLVAQKKEELGSAADVRKDANGLITDIVEADSHQGGAGLANTGLYLLDKRIFDYPPVKVKGREETGLPQTMLLASKDVPLHVLETDYFMAMTSPEDLIMAEGILGGK